MLEISRKHTERVGSGKESEAGGRGKRRVERLSATTKRNITEWVVPLAYERLNRDIVDQGHTALA